MLESCQVLGPSGRSAARHARRLFARLTAPALLVSAALVCAGVSAAEATGGDRRLADAAMHRDVATVAALLKQRVDPNVPGDFGTPPLLWLTQFDEVEAVRQLLDAGANVQALTPLGVSALSLAIANGSAPMVQLLLEAGADPAQLEPAGETLLMSAAAVGVDAVVEALLAAGAAVNAVDATFGQTALMVAAREGHADVVETLLAAGASVNLQTVQRGEPVWVRPNSQQGFGFGIGIIRGGTPADRGRRDPLQGGMSALLYAARHGHVDVARQLLAAGADLNVRDANEIWPLLLSISNNNMAMAEFLLQQDGVLINGQDFYGRSPLWEAVNVRNLYIHNETYEHSVERAPVLALIERLLEAGADPDVRTRETPPVRQHILPITGTLEWVDFTGQTPFLAAALAGDVTVMKLLLQHGADPMIGTFLGTSPLMAAAGVNWVMLQTYTEGEAQSLEAVKLCHSLGMDVNQANSMGITALMGAANRGSDSIIRYLAEQGADLSSLDNEKRSALDWAKGVFLATHPAEEKPVSVALLGELLKAQGKEIR